MHRVLITAATLFVLGAATGCGDDDGAEPSESATPTETRADRPPTGSKPAPGTKSGSTVTVDMKAIAFAPKRARVKVGQTVRWVNRDEADHNVSSDEFESKTFGKGGTYSYRAKTPAPSRTSARCIPSWRPR